MAETAWWEKRWFLALVVLASTIPLLLPETPPLVDVPGHMGRFRIQLDLANSRELQRYFEFHWALVGNLGTDLLVMALAPLVGLELAVKLIVIAIPPITVAGIFWVAKEIHGRIPPSSLFAMPFVYGFPFNFGFINFSLSVGLALVAFGYWLRLTNQSRFRLRAALFIPISCALWVVHAFGWGILGLLAFSAEVFRVHDRGGTWPRTFIWASLAMLPLAPPIAIMAAGHGAVVVGSTDQFFQVKAKAFALLAVLRDRWVVWDSFGLGAAVVLLIAATIEPMLEFSRKLAIPGIILAVTFLIMPGEILGLLYADMRLAPVMLIIALLAVRISDGHERLSQQLAFLGLIFFALRLIGSTVSFVIADRDMRSMLTALDHIPRGAPVLSLVGEFCSERWKMPRYAHIGGFVIVRRNGFSNDQWQAAGAQLLRVRYPAAGSFREDRSTVIYSDRCLVEFEKNTGKLPSTNHRILSALRQFPRQGFDYVWIVEPPGFDMRPMPGLTPVWRRKDAVLYRIDH